MRIRYYGHLQQETGYGRAALDLASALARAGHQLEVRTIGPRPEAWTPPAGFASGPGTPEVVIVHTLPGDCPRVLELEGLRRGAGPKLVAYTTWEALSAPPDLVSALIAGFDQVWVPSWATAAAFKADKPGGESVHVLPHCFDESVYRPLASGNGFVYRFYWIGAWTARKNPSGLIRAFALAFGPGDPVELVLHSPGCPPDSFALALAQTGLDQSDLPRIALSNRHVSADTVARMHVEADCFVTAARGEAWNLPAFDAMLAGRHVIAQRGLGSDDFLQHTSAELINGWEAPAMVDVVASRSDDASITMKTVGAQGLTSRSCWLEPDLWALSEAMRWAVQRRTRTIDLAYDPAERFGYAAVAKLALDMLETKP